MISKDTARKVLSAALKTGADLAEVYVEDHTSLSLEMDESRLEKAIRGADRGAGVRVFFGNLVTYAFTDNLSEESLLQAAAAASAAARGSSKSPLVDLTERKSALEYPVRKPFDTMSIAEKAAILSRMDEAARASATCPSRV